MIFLGNCTALVTPFKKNGKINFEILKGLINEQIESGTSAILVLGTTGESSTLSKEEKIDINPFLKIDELISLGYKPNEAIKEVSKLINVNRKELYNDYVEYKNQR